jgi:integrase
MTADEYSPRTVRIALGVLRRALKQAVRWRFLARNVADDVELPKRASREMPALTPAQVAKFREHASGSTHAVLFDLLLATGMRPGEALAVRWQDLDARAGAIAVLRALTWETRPNERPRRAAVFLEPKAHSRRTIPLPPSVIRDLAAHRAAQAERAMKLGAVYDRDADLIFANEIGRPLDERNLLQRHFRPIVIAAKLDPKLRLYDLRHVHASLLLAGGESVKVVSERLGHASAAMTLDVYSHVLPGLQERATKRIEAVLFAAQGQE